MTNERRNKRKQGIKQSKEEDDKKNRRKGKKTGEQGKLDRVKGKLIRNMRRKTNKYIVKLGKK